MLNPTYSAMMLNTWLPYGHGIGGLHKALHALSGGNDNGSTTTLRTHWTTGGRRGRNDFGRQAVFGDLVLVNYKPF